MIANVTVRFDATTEGQKQLLEMKAEVEGTGLKAQALMQGTRVNLTFQVENDTAWVEKLADKYPAVREILLKRA